MDANNVFLDLMRDLGVPEETLKNVKLPGPDTPLPPTNATLHILDYETGYGTKDRKFHMICGTVFAPNNGEHKYFYEGERHWYKHVNCEKCKELILPK